MQAKRRSSTYRQQPLKLDVETSLPYNGVCHHSHRKLASKPLAEGDSLFCFSVHECVACTNEGSTAGACSLPSCGIQRKASDTPATPAVCGWGSSCVCWGLKLCPPQESQPSYPLNYGSKTTHPHVRFTYTNVVLQSFAWFILCMWVFCLCTTSV